MSTQKAKFELFSQLQKLGFSYNDACTLRRIGMTLSRWAEAECNGEIERDETTGKPERVSSAYINGPSGALAAMPVADRETGALRRLKAIMRAHPSLWSYHQSDPRGCALYIGRRADLPRLTVEQIARMHGESAAKTPTTRAAVTLSQYYTRGIAVCA